MNTAIPRPPLDPRGLVGAAREDFVKDLFAAHERIFDGVDRSTFEHYVLDAPSTRTRIQTYHDQTGKTVGYAAAHFYERRVQGRSVTILRGQLGLEPAYRGGAAVGRFALSEGLAHRVTHPRSELFFLGCLVSPASYCMFARRVDDVVPHWQRPQRVEDAALLRDVAEACGLKPLSETNPWICAVGWRSRETPEERRRWQNSDDPRVRFFLEKNPDYSEGLGLLTMFRVALPTIAKAGIRLGWQAVERAGLRTVGLAPWGAV